MTCVMCGWPKDMHVFGPCRGHYTEYEGFNTLNDGVFKVSANETQVGGIHYRKKSIQHWDYVAANDLDYFQGQITKYVSRWKDKNGLQDLRKAQHFLEKYIEVEEAKAKAKGP